jgi:hypothetical protein
MNYNDYKLHAILYAKGHYKQDRKMTGLRIIVGHYACMDPQHIDDEHLMHFALMLLEEFTPASKKNVSDVIFATFKDCWMWRPRRRVFNRIHHINRLDIVQGVLMVLRHIMVKDLPPLPVADEKVAPLKVKVKYPLPNKDVD